MRGDIDAQERAYVQGRTCVRGGIDVKGACECWARAALLAPFDGSEEGAYHLGLEYMNGGVQGGDMEGNTEGLYEEGRKLLQLAADLGSQEVREELQRV